MRTSNICYSVSRLARAVCEWLVELGEERNFKLLWSTLLNAQMQKPKPCKGKRQLCLAGRLRVSEFLLLPTFSFSSFPFLLSLLLLPFLLFLLSPLLPLPLHL